MQRRRAAGGRRRYGTGSGSGRGRENERGSRDEEVSVISGPIIAETNIWQNKIKSRVGLPSVRSFPAKSIVGSQRKAEMGRMCGAIRVEAFLAISLATNHQARYTILYLHFYRRRMSVEMDFGHFNIIAHKYTYVTAPCKIEGHFEPRF